MLKEIREQLEDMRAKYAQTVEMHEKEIQKLMRENLLQKRKLMNEVEEKMLQISQIERGREMKRGRKCSSAGQVGDIFKKPIFVDISCFK